MDSASGHSQDALRRQWTDKQPGLLGRWNIGVQVAAHMPTGSDEPSPLALKGKVEPFRTIKAHETFIPLHPAQAEAETICGSIDVLNYNDQSHRTEPPLAC